MLPADLFLGVPGSTMKLTPGVGMTLLIGVAGSFFLVAQSHRLLRSKLSQRRRSSRKPDVAECYMCNANIELESTDSFATCRGCERLVCRGENCCQWVESIGIWECTGCQSNRVIQQKAGEWLLNQLTARLQQPGPVELKEGNLLGLGLDSEDARSTTSSTVSVNQRIKVREFIEELLSSMLHGPLDDVSVGQLMKHESYIRLFRKFHTRLSRCLYNLELSIHHSLMSGKSLKSNGI
uniref:FYVE-type zinc finger domain-containing protein n=1 Tax=Anopheles atroparvus TaxID=41427 RepID=A0AAG5DHW4_ANOAO